MFEDSLMESQHSLSSPNQRWTTIGSLTLQCAIVAAVISLPLLHTEALPFRTDAPTITLPLKPLPPRISHVDTAIGSRSSATVPSAPASAQPRIDLHTSQYGRTITDAPPSTNLSGTMGGFGSASVIPGTTGTTAGLRVTLAHAAPQTKGILQMSKGVSLGLLLTHIRPAYPPIARDARVQGTVVVEAIISKTGTIGSIHATSGPEMLRNAAIDAVRNARYTPYLLNGAPTEIQTTITVDFRLSS